MKFVLFTDNLADLTVPEACAAARRAGFDGLDLTLRPGGHVRPENAGPGLAEARRAADAAGLALPMVSTALTDDDSPHPLWRPDPALIRPGLARGVPRR